MTKYVENVNMYLSEMKIKQSYISLKSGIDKNKLSRILTGVQDITGSDMEKIAGALGKKMEFFFDEAFLMIENKNFVTKEVAFYAGEPSKEQEEYAMNLIELIENADEVLSAKGRFMMGVGE